jgi:hypothetical protein
MASLNISNSPETTTKRDIYRIGTAFTNDYTINEMSVTQDFRQQAFPEKIHPSYSPGKITFSKPATQMSLRTDQGFR